MKFQRLDEHSCDHLDEYLDEHFDEDSYRSR